MESINKTESRHCIDLWRLYSISKNRGEMTNDGICPPQSPVFNNWSPAGGPVQGGWGTLGRCGLSRGSKFGWGGPCSLRRGSTSCPVSTSCSAELSADSCCTHLQPWSCWLPYLPCYSGPYPLHLKAPTKPSSLELSLVRHSSHND